MFKLGKWDFDSFYKSVFFGVFIWFFFFFTTPVKVVNPLSTQTVLFIVCNYLALIFGYLVSDFSISRRTSHSGRTKVVFFFTLLVLFSCLFRYLDLFFFRGISIFNSSNINKKNAAKEENFSLIFGLISMFRFLYFIPFLFHKFFKVKPRTWLVIICYLFFLVPIFEGFLRGSRRLILQPILIFILINFVLNRFKKIFNSRNIVIVLVLFLVLAIVGNKVLIEREDLESREFFKKITSARYNDLLPLKKEAKEYFIDDTTNEEIRNLVFSYTHFGQYIVHGAYEFDYTTKTEFTPKFGLYNGFIVVKLLNKLGVTNIPLKSLYNPSKRVTYITFFGGLYVDFSWFSLLIMFVFGVFQKYIFVASKNSFYFVPIMILLILMNSFLLVFNFLRSELLITIIIYSITIFFLKIILNFRKT